MKVRFSSLWITVLLVALLLGSQGSAVQAEPVKVKGQTGLTQAEIDGLLYMREEEKLAHDVYVALYAKYRLNVFSNISSAELNHMSAVKTLLDRYGLPDPAKGNGVGVFSNEQLQVLYDALILRGSQSLPEALKVGGAIEEIDISDLETHLATTNRSDIHTVYSNLESASCNHLRAFVSTLQRRTGEIYQPQYLSIEDYQAIINGIY